MAQKETKGQVSTAELKRALAETLKDNPRLLFDAVTEVLEDFAMTRAIREGARSGLVKRETVFRILKGRE